MKTLELHYPMIQFFAFDKGERLHSAVAFENFGAFIDTDLAPPKNSSGAKLFRENDVIFIGHVLNLVLRLSLLCLLNEVAMCSVSTRSPVSRLPRVLVCFLVQFDLLFAFGMLSCRILDSASLFVLYVHDYNRLGFGMLTVETAVFDCICDNLLIYFQPRQKRSVLSGRILFGIGGRVL